MASSSSPSSFSSPAIYSQSWIYDVFLSFYGEDTRKNFVDHLYIALKEKGIYTYKDDITLPRGESIGPSLKKAIGASEIAVIVFSENYANSTWCLDELAHIFRCKDTTGQIILPIFYHVDPSEVGIQKGKNGQKGKYEEAISKHELENKNNVESWRKALEDASNISGWELKQVANGHEAQGIKEIVKTISHRLHPLTSSANKNLIGMEDRIQRLRSDLQIWSGGVRMIGIRGMSGVGKTTLASCLFDAISRKFEGCCFLKNIREESQKNGLERLQEKLLSDVLQQNQVQVPRVEQGRRLIMGMFCHRKVLIVLDDVDHIRQLVALAGSQDWFGEGSRIIITARSELILRAHRVDVIHNISLLHDEEAMKLFCMHANWNNHKLLSKEVVSNIGGIPLTLKVLGCFLRDKDLNEWRSALARLIAIPANKILEKLKISFDGLTPVEKRLFLDIACFFRMEHRDEGVMMILDARGHNHVRGIDVLRKRALITFLDGKFEMHDLIKELAHYIVRGRPGNNPYKKIRVLNKEDYVNICATEAMRALGDGGDDGNDLLSFSFEPRLMGVAKETEKNDRVEMERLEKGKNKVESEAVEDRIVNRMKGFVTERLDSLENRMVEMEGVVKKVENLTDKMMDTMDMLRNTIMKRKREPDDKVE